MRIFGSTTQFAETNEAQLASGGKAHFEKKKTKKTIQFKNKRITKKIESMEIT